MSYAQSNFSFSLGMRKILSYYLGFSILFFLTHLSLVSIVTFFHFLIDHDMHIIENWLFSNAWELIISSKLIAFIVTIKFLKLNNYLVTDLLTILKTDIWKPSKSAFVMIVFLATCFSAILLQFGDGLSFNPKSLEYVYFSYVGSILFFVIDFLVINILLRNVKQFSRRKNSLLIASLLIIFLSFTKITLPYIDKFLFIIILHFLTLLIFLFSEKRNIMNIILYSVLLIGPLASLFGFDLVWENAHAVYIYNTKLPLTGIVGVWLIGIVYYYKRKSVHIDVKIEG